MSDIDEEKVRNWGLTFSDLISTKLKTNINFKNLAGEEVIYSEFITKNQQSKWISLYEETENQQSMIITIDYKAIIACTNHFFSTNSSGELDHAHLSFTEEFIAQEVCNEILQSFTDNNIAAKFIRNEPELNLVHPFHEDESITVYTYEWTIGSKNFGALNLCHSHVL
ncbi:MAG: hypothetical protein VW397_09105 [Candidatus Margulisiibacteriota bacterium]